MKRVRTNKRKQLPIILVIGLLLVVGVVVAVVFQLPTAGLLKPSPATPSSSPRNEADFKPKTDSEQAQRGQTQASPTPNANPALKPVITGVDGDTSASAAQISVDALVGEATSGTCKATLTQGANTHTATSQITRIATYYACTTLRFDKAALAAGPASVVVTLTAPNGTGTSDPRNVTITK